MGGPIDRRIAYAPSGRMRQPTRPSEGVALGWVWSRPSGDTIPDPKPCSHSENLPTHDMNFAHFFIQRPIFASVLSIVLVLVGSLAAFQLPIAQYPDIVPPRVVVRAVYPGANPKVVAETVATPIEQEVNGVEDTLYMSSTSTSDGVMMLTITFKLGTDLNTAQVLVQNRVVIALPKLPEEVRRLGVTTTKRSSDLTMVAHLVSPDASRDELYLGNYAFLQVKDQLAHIPGVGEVTVFGARDYSMRVWLDPERVAARQLTPTDVVRAIREQNLQVAAGIIGQPPIPPGNDFQLTINTRGRLLDEAQFGDIILKRGTEGQVTRVRDVARVELAARDYSIASQLNGKPAAALVIWQLPGSNAIETSDAVRAKLEELKLNSPVSASLERSQKVITRGRDRAFDPRGERHGRIPRVQSSRGCKSTQCRNDVCFTR